VEGARCVIAGLSYAGGSDRIVQIGVLDWAAGDVSEVGGPMEACPAVSIAVRATT
jgi:hypothetical protein